MLEINKVYNMDCIDGMKLIEDNSIDSIVTDPPYGIEFMSKEWDSFSDNTNSALGKQSPANKKENTPFKKTISGWCEKDKIYARQNYYNFTYQWAKEAYRILKPGGFMLVFGSPRMYHRMTCAIEDVGFEIRDCIMWIYSQGFPKSLDISEAIDKKLGTKRKIISETKTKSGGMAHLMKTNAEQGFRSSNYYKEQGNVIQFTEPVTSEAKQWNGWGTALKPANEPIAIARKPLSEKSVADNILKWGTGGINIDGCRIEPTGEKLRGGAKDGSSYNKCHEGYNRPWKNNEEWRKLAKEKSDKRQEKAEKLGRWPSNVILDEETGKLLNEQSGIKNTTRHMSYKRSGGEFINGIPSQPENGWFKQETSGVSRFFYCAKASKKEKSEFNNHPTVKPLSLIKYLITLVTPPEGVCLDPFEGSGTHAVACKELNIKYIGFEKEAEYCDIIEKRLQEVNYKIL